MAVVTELLDLIDGGLEGGDSTAGGGGGEDCILPEGPSVTTSEWEVNRSKSD